MRVKSLELVGFKSFVDRTTIHFEEGITGVVGPNGCGKSNIVDAIRWVMGEQSAKHLRGGVMGDVIFNGTETRPSMGMASVSLTFDNSDGRAPADYADYSEITVGRRLYRSGESEYFINKTSCRLKDIVDLFLGTGVGTKAYAIVEQGMIGQILTAKPEERRMLIEEAAGISKFKARKEAALRKMEATSANLERLTDILAELDRQMNSLYRQAKKAERFKNYSEELKNLELALRATEYRDLKKELGELKNQLDSIGESELMGMSKLSQEETDIATAKLKLSELETTWNRLQEDLYAKQNEVQLTEADIAYQSKDLSQVTDAIRRSEVEIKELAGRLSTLRSELKEANERKVAADLTLTAAEEGLVGMDQEVGETREAHHQMILSLEESRKRVFECVEKVSRLSSRLEQRERREKELHAWITRDQIEIDRMDEETRGIEGKAGSRGSDVTGTKQLKLQIESDMSAARATLARQTEELATAELKIQTLKEELGAKRSRLHSLSEFSKNYEGYQEGVRAVLKRREEVDDFEGVVGTINDIVETEPRYEGAVGAVLGEKLQYVVVKSHEVGLQAIDYLKVEASGRSTFVPLELRAEPTYAVATDRHRVGGEGVVGPLINYIRYADDHKKIVDYLFGDVVLVEDLEKALNLWTANGSRCRLVTLDGTVVDPTGVVSGGAGGDVSRQMITHRREIKELTEAVGILTRESNVEEQLLLRFRDRVKGLTKNIERLEQEERHEEIKLITQETDLNHLQSQLSSLRIQRDKLTVEVAEFSEELSAIGREKVTAEEEYHLHSRQKTVFEEEVSSKQEKENELRAALQELLQKRAELGLATKTEQEKLVSLDKEIARIITSLVETRSSIAHRECEIACGEKTTEVGQFDLECRRASLANAIQAIDALKRRYTEVKNLFDADSARLQEKEAGIRELRKTHEGQMKNRHEIELAYTQKLEKSNYKSREIFERYRVDLERSYEDYLSEGLDLGASSEKVAELKTKIDGIGPVNVDAIHEYEEIKTRHDFLKNQYDDLITSLEDLKTAISKINKTSRARFQEAFASVNERFQKLFPKLFEGGKAHLALLEGEDILEAGVDIIAQPPGKKLQSITLLSGGEKALTAVALIFALFLHHPSPFCLLDEVDAPLDDANIDRFNDLIREMTRLSQFILITHNKRTMELADKLYGVTMEERGASKMISLSLADKRNEAQAA